MNLLDIEKAVRVAGAAVLALALLVALAGITRGLRRPRGQATGQAKRMLRLPMYLLIGAGFFGACFVLWQPIPLELAAAGRAASLALGALLYFPGLGLYLWARAALGEMYGVSSSLGAQLYADHRLITHGPFTLVRHPIYLGIMLTAAGGLFLYRTWTFLFLAVAFLGLVLRARQEEQVLAAAFGHEWQAYCQRVPAWLPHVRQRDGR